MSALAIALDKEIHLVARLLQLLQDEQAILVSGSAERLEALTADKNIVIGEIELATREREACLPPGCAPADNAAMTSWLVSHPEEKAAAAAWEKLLDISRKAKAEHEKNGLLINTLISKTSEALAILTQHRQDHSLYGRDGQTAGNFGRRILDSA